MIAPLRNRHRRVVTVLAVLVPVGFVAGILSRSPDPTAEAIPGELRAELREAPGQVVWARSDLWRDLPVDTALNRASDGRLFLTLQPRSDLKRPEVLAYWAPPGESEKPVPENAVLLGRLQGTLPSIFELPGVANGTPGRLLLYSLGHQELLKIVSLPEHE